MKIESLLGSIAANWQKDFINFVQTGDASADFLNYLDGDLQAQTAVEMAFTEQAQALEGLAQLVKSDPSTLEKPSRAEGASSAVARAFEQITELSGEERTRAVAGAAKTLVYRAATEPKKAATLLSTLSALQHEVGSLVR